MHTGLGRRTGGTSDSLGSQFLPGRLENRFFLGLPGVFFRTEQGEPISTARLPLPRDALCAACVAALGTAGPRAGTGEGRALVAEPWGHSFFVVCVLELYASGVGSVMLEKCIRTFIAGPLI